MTQAHSKNIAVSHDQTSSELKKMIDHRLSYSAYVQDDQIDEKSLYGALTIEHSPNSGGQNSMANTRKKNL